MLVSACYYCMHADLICPLSSDSDQIALSLDARRIANFELLCVYMCRCSRVLGSLP